MNYELCIMHYELCIMISPSKNRGNHTPDYRFSPWYDEGNAVPLHQKISNNPLKQFGLWNVYYSQSHRHSWWLHLLMRRDWPTFRLKHALSLTRWCWNWVWAMFSVIIYWTLIPQHFDLTLFISTWATKSCSGFCHVRFFTYLSVANQNMYQTRQTWQR